ncbi:MAG: TIGR00374 family protein, partial [Rhodospirillales bacterium]|nr:TIGR00374 family protein [Rhodospirillales bacterium]
MKRLSYALALAGLLIAIGLVAYFGIGNIMTALSRIGWPGFALIVGWQFVLFAILGLAWDIVVPPRSGKRVWVMIWGRMVRDALDLLPVGGLVVELGGD